MTWCFTLIAINTWLSFLFSESSSVCDNLHLHHWWHSWGVSFFTQFSLNNEYFWQVSIFVFKQGRTFFWTGEYLGRKTVCSIGSPIFLASFLCVTFAPSMHLLFFGQVLHLLFLARSFSLKAPSFFWSGPFHSKTHSQWYDIYYMRRYLEELLLALCFQLAGYIGGQSHPFIITKEA